MLMQLRTRWQIEMYAPRREVLRAPVSSTFVDGGPQDTSNGEITGREFVEQRLGHILSMESAPSPDEVGGGERGTKKDYQGYFWHDEKGLVQSC